MRWEYRRVSKALAARGTDELDHELATLGAEGWEAVGVAIANVNSITVLLKRPVER